MSEKKEKNQGGFPLLTARETEVDLGNGGKIKVHQLPPIKFKDGSADRGGIRLNILKLFGAPVEDLLIQKVKGENNVIVISAIFPEYGTVDLNNVKPAKPKTKKK